MASMFFLWRHRSTRPFAISLIDINPSFQQYRWSEIADRFLVSLWSQSENCAHRATRWRSNAAREQTDMLGTTFPSLRFAQNVIVAGGRGASRARQRGRIG